MKLRLAKDTVRLRVLKSEVTALASGSQLRETLILGPAPSACITYALQGAAAADNLPSISFRGNELTVSVPSELMTQWATSDEVGIYARVDNGTAQPIQLIVEKDFACLDRNDAENADTYQHPKTMC